MPQQQTDILQYPSKNMYSRYSSCLYLIYNINNYPVPFFQIAKKDAQGQSDKKSLITCISCSDSACAAAAIAAYTLLVSYIYFATVCTSK